MSNNNLQLEIQKLLHELKALIAQPPNIKDTNVSSKMGFDKYKRSRSPKSPLRIATPTTLHNKVNCSFCNKPLKHSPKFRSIKLTKTSVQPVQFCSTHCFSEYKF